MRNYEKMCEAILTKGVLNAYGKMNKTPKAECECGFCLPQYSGRYPKCCPICGETLTMIGPNGNLAQVQNGREEQSGGEIMELPDEEVENKEVEKVEKENTGIEPLAGSAY